MAEETYRQRVDAVTQREAKALKKEQELTNRHRELERRNRAMDELEERHGTFAQRESDMESREKDCQQMVKESKRRDKTLRDLEAKLTERENVVYQSEQASSSKEKELASKTKSVEDKERSLRDQEERLIKDQRAFSKQADEQERCRTDLDAREAKVKELEANANQRQAALDSAESDLGKRDASVTEREQTTEKNTQALNQRNVALTAREAKVQTERDRQMKRREQIDEAEKKAEADTKFASTKRDEIQRRLAQVAEEEREMNEKVNETNRTFAEAAKKKDEASKEFVEARKLEAEVSSQKTDLKRFEAQLRQRERKAAAMERHTENREEVLAVKESDMREEREQLDVRIEEVDAKEEDIRGRERALAAKLKELEAETSRVQQREQMNTRKTYHMKNREKELVDWMKEMEWREMMLGDREAVIDREPVSLPTKHGEKRPSSRSGYSNRSFGHAVVEVQLRRLKDQYISAQMKHAQEELRTGSSPYSKKSKSPPQKHKRLPRAGIALTHPEAGVDDEIAVTSTLRDLRQKTHELSTQFIRSMARTRAFDGFEDPQSPEKLEQLGSFTDSQRTTLAMATNMEYLLKVHEHFFVQRMSCPLDEKDLATDTTDLVNRTSRWWSSTKTHMQTCLTQLLKDRDRYLTEALSIIHAHPDVFVKNDARLEGEGSARLNNSEAVVYTGDSSYEHAKESKVIGVRGMATLRATSAALAHEKEGLSDDRGSHITAAAASRPATTSPGRSRKLSAYQVDLRGRRGRLVDFDLQNGDVEFDIMRCGRAVNVPPKTSQEFKLEDVKIKKAAAVSPYGLKKSGMVLDYSCTSTFKHLPGTPSPGKGRKRAASATPVKALDPDFGNEVGSIR